MLWEVSNIYINRKNSSVNLRVLSTQLPQLTTHGPSQLEVSPLAPPRNYVEGNNQVFILISHSTTSNIVFYSSLDLEVTILFHSSCFLTSTLKFSYCLHLLYNPLISLRLGPGCSFKPSPASPALPGYTGHPLLGEPVAPPCFLNSRLCYLAPYLTAFPGSLTGSST